MIDPNSGESKWESKWKMKWKRLYRIIEGLGILRLQGDPNEDPEILSSLFLLESTSMASTEVSES